MFGNFAPFIPAPAELTQPPPESVPPPTPVNFPRYQPGTNGDDAKPEVPQGPLTSVLQSIIRPTEVNAGHLEALGVHVTADAPLNELIPHPELTLPNFAVWDELTRDECHAHNEATRSPLGNGNLSPGCLVYLDRKRELSTPNSAAFRAVRRIQPPKGQPQARLGNSYEFFRFLEMFAAFWDDTSRPKEQQQHSEDGKGGAESTMSGSGTSTDSPEKAQTTLEPPVTYRTGSGSQMPPDFRQNILSAFLKLVAYDFGCNVSAPRVEPRLYLTSTIPSPPGSSEPKTRSSYFSSGCTFIFRTPTTREAARAGIVEGPLAAVSARHTTSFPPSPHARTAPTAPTTDSSPSTPTTPKPKPSPERDSLMDLSRELIAALLTAQHRSRQHKTETRIGETSWWATKPRWGGGTGGPIGREVEMLFSPSSETVLGDKDAPPESPPEISALAAGASLSSPYPPGVRSPGIPSRLASFGPSSEKGGEEMVSPKGTKRLKKSTPGGGGTLPVYDSYRMIRPPSSTWDKKVRYEAIGRVPGTDYDDIFVISSLFHHVSVVRVRVPDRLLEVLDGAVEEEARSWGELEVWRSKWFDFFVPEERVEAMRCVWGVMSWMMRRVEGGGSKE